MPLITPNVTHSLELYDDAEGSISGVPYGRRNIALFSGLNDDHTILVPEECLIGRSAEPGAGPAHIIRIGEGLELSYLNDQGCGLLTSTGGQGSSARWYIQAGTPSSALGVELDLFINSLNGDVYQKRLGAWVVTANIRGPQGVNGPVGPAGPVGPMGPEGPLGAQGLIGPAGPVGPVGPAGGLGDAAIDGNIYGRKNASWTLIPDVTPADVNKAYVDSQVATRATPAYVDSQVATRTTSNYVDSQVATRATPTYVDNKVADRVIRTGDTMTGRLDLSSQGLKVGPAGNITARINSGFYENSAGSIATGWPTNNGWHHLIACTHSNDSNYFSTQISATFAGATNTLYWRTVDNNGAIGWRWLWDSGNFAPSSYVAKSGDSMSGSLTVNGNFATNAISCSSVDYYANGYYHNGASGAGNWYDAAGNANRFYVGTEGDDWRIYSNAFGNVVHFYSNGTTTIHGHLDITAHSGITVGTTEDYGLIYWGNTGVRYLEMNSSNVQWANVNFSIPNGTITAGGDINTGTYSNLHCWIVYAEAISCVEWCNVGSLSCGGHAHANWMSTDGGMNCGGELAVGGGDYGVQRLGNPGAGRYWEQNGGTMVLKGIGDLRQVDGNFFCGASIDCNGSLSIQGQGYKPGGGDWGDNSDARIKNVLGNYDAGLDQILSLQPVRFTFKGNDTTEPPSNLVGAPYNSSRHYEAATKGTEFVGLVAQDAEQSMPELVKLAEGYIDGAAVSDLREVDTTPLIYAMINAIKTLTARIEKLERGGSNG